MELEYHLTIKQVAARLQLSQRTIRRWIKSEQLRATKFPGRFGVEYRIPLSALAELGFGVVQEEK